MNPCQYFIKDAHTLANQIDPQAEDPFHRVRGQLIERGFGPVLEQVQGNGTVFPVRHSGPGGSDGAILVTWPRGRSCDTVGYFPDLQTWNQVRSDIWVGWSADTPVLPDDLDNGNLWSVSGVPLRLADQQFWVIPQIRRAGSHTLPTELYRDQTGRLVTPIKERFLHLWNESQYFFDVLFDAVMADGSVTINLERTLKFACDVLALRYRWTEYTQDALKVIDHTNVTEIVKIAIGWDVVQQRLQELLNPDQKKSLHYV